MPWRCAVVAYIRKMLSVIVTLMSGDKPGYLLESIRPQLGAEAELVVVADESDQSLCTRIDSWVERHRKRLKNCTVVQTAIGNRCEGRNIGVRTASGSHVMFLEPWQQLAPGAIEAIAKEVASNPVELLVAETARRDADGWTEPTASNDSNLVRAHLLNDYISVPRLIVAVDLLRRIGGYDENNPSTADFLLGCRLLAGAANVGRVGGHALVYVSDDERPATNATDRQMISALKEAETALSEHADAAKWLSARKMIAAGELARRKDEKCSHELSESALNAAASGGERIKLGFIRDTQRYFGYGGAALARLIL